MNVRTKEKGGKNYLIFSNGQETVELEVFLDYDVYWDLSDDNWIPGNPYSGRWL